MCERMDWETVFHGVGVRYEEKIVRVRTDDALMRYLAEPGRGAMALAEHIAARYREKLGCALDISERSLAVEILAHAYCDALLLRAAKLAQKLPESLGARLTQAVLHLQQHTDIIDIGERSVDSNRWLFDDLAPFYSVICAILGDKA